MLLSYQSHRVCQSFHVCLSRCVCVCLAQALERWEIFSLAPRLATPPWPLGLVGPYFASLHEMAWKQCSKCKWWSRPGDVRNSCGCTQASSRSTALPSSAVKKPPPSVSRLPTGEDLAHRWQMARTAASNVHHVKIEKVCAVCHSRSFANKQLCRACGTSLDGAYTLLPGKWPPLGVPPQVLAMYEPQPDQPAPAVGPATASATAALDSPMDGQHQAVSPVPPPGLQSMSIPQLKAEIAKLDKSLHDPLLSEGSVLRTATLQTISDLRAELAGRKSSGQQLDQALAKEKTARQAREAAAAHICGLEQSLETARRTFQQAKEAEEQAAADTSRIRAQLAEGDPSVGGQDSFCLPVEVSSAIYGILRQAGIPPTKVNGLLTSLGVGDVPPQPPLPPPVSGTTGLPASSVPAELPVAGNCMSARRTSSTVNCDRKSPSPSVAARSRSGTPRGRRPPSQSSRGTSHTARTARTQLDTPSTTLPASLAPAP